MGCTYCNDKEYAAQTDMRKKLMVASAPSTGTFGGGAMQQKMLTKMRMEKVGQPTEIPGMKARFKSRGMNA